MAERTENVIFGTFRALAELENGDLIIDRNENELVPADQVIKDPGRIEMIDFLKQDTIGCLRLSAADAEDEEVEEVTEETVEEVEGELD